MRNPGLEEAQAGIKIARRNINKLRYADGTIFVAERKEEWECKLIQPLWKMVWRFLKNLGIKPPYDPTIPLLGI